MLNLHNWEEKEIVLKFSANGTELEVIFSSYSGFSIISGVNWPSFKVNDPLVIDSVKEYIL